MKKISYCFLFLLVFFGCGDESSNQDEIVKDEVFEGKPKKITWEKDGREMVLIPAGSFEMGDHFSEGYKRELPVHTVTLDAFYMDTHEVTVGQFKQFVNQSEYDYDFDEIKNGGFTISDFSPTDDHPMIWVNWNYATAYAEWAGKRLPTEAEWEYAARGGLEGRRYPWGDEIDDSKANYDDNVGTTTVAGSYPVNGYGLYDMAGNVWEWCQDRYDGNYYTNSPVNNPQGPETGRRRVLRGGSWRTHATYLRLASRYNDPSPRDSPYGFRCVSGSN